MKFDVATKMNKKNSFRRILALNKTKLLYIKTEAATRCVVIIRHANR